MSIYPPKKKTASKARMAMVTFGSRLIYLPKTPEVLINNIARLISSNGLQADVDAGVGVDGDFDFLITSVPIFSVLTLWPFPE